MPETIPLSEDKILHGDITGRACRLCGRARTELLSVAALPEDLRTIIKANAAMESAEEICPRCVELFVRAKKQLDSHAAIFEQNAFVLPTPLRMDADERFSGRGVTIAFLDSGF